MVFIILIPCWGRKHLIFQVLYFFSCRFIILIPCWGRKPIVLFLFICIVLHIIYNIDPLLGTETVQRTPPNLKMSFQIYNIDPLLGTETLFFYFYKKLSFLIYNIDPLLGTETVTFCEM